MSTGRAWRTGSVRQGVDEGRGEKFTQTSQGSLLNLADTLLGHAETPAKLLKRKWGRFVRQPEVPRLSQVARGDRAGGEVVTGAGGRRVDSLRYA